MISLIKNSKIKEFGDFQTPSELAFEVCQTLSRLNVRPSTIVEPTCGLGNFIQAATKVFYPADIHGFEISSEYSEFATSKFQDNDKVSISQADFFDEDWIGRLKELPKPLLVLGNPPWVTNSQLSILDSSNVPTKKNLNGLSGLDAMTGKSNFDISEWMLTQIMNALDRQDAFLAILCKTSVARKVLKYAWKSGIRLSRASIYKIETEKHFNASVDSCLLFCEFSKSSEATDCKVFENLRGETPIGEFGFINDELVASIDRYEKWKHLNGGNEIKWRSGIKHDCSKVIEFTKELFGYQNGSGEIIDLEDDFMYPMLKSSDLANSIVVPRRWMLVTQKTITADTAKIQDTAPKTWNYLVENGNYLDKRGSTIYKKRFRFAMFGIGDYTFSPWKVAISGFYKHLKFSVVGSSEGKPIVLDDTCYFIPFDSEVKAKHVCQLLNSKIAQEFLESFIFWDAKRPISAEILQKLNISKLDELENSIAKLGWDEAITRFKQSGEIEFSRNTGQNILQFD